MLIEIALVILVIGPLCAAIVSVLLARWAYPVCVGAGVIQLIAVVAVVSHLLQSGPIRYSIGGWGAPLGIDLYLDGISGLMLILATTVCSFIAIYAKGYFDASSKTGTKNPQQFFWPIFMLTWAALSALFVSADFFNLYVTLELLTLAAVALVGSAGSADALVAALSARFAWRLCTGVCR